MKKWMIEMDDSWVPGSCDWCDKIDECAGSEVCPIIEAKQCIEAKSGLDICWGDSQAYDFHSRNKIKVYMVEA